MRARPAIVAVLALAGCGAESDPASAPPQRACTEIGCAPEGVHVDFARMPNGNVDVELCVEKRKCVRDDSRGASQQGIGDFLPKGRDRVRVTMIVRKNGREIARATRRLPVRISRPNGPDCPPPCRYVNARFDVRTSTLEEA